MLSEVEVLEHVKTMRADGQRWEDIASSVSKLAPVSKFVSFIFP